MKQWAAISVLLLGLFHPLGFMHAGPLRIALLADTTIQGDTILLSHLLPSNIPLELRRRAENISLGRAPEIGSVRSFSRESLQAALEETGIDAAGFVIPERVAVRRDAHLLSMERLAREYSFTGPSMVCPFGLAGGRFPTGSAGCSHRQALEPGALSAALPK